MKKYYVKRYWEVCDEVAVMANSENEAAEKASALLLSSGTIVPDSLNIDPDTDVKQALDI